MDEPEWFPILERKVLELKRFAQTYAVAPAIVDSVNLHFVAEHLLLAVEAYVLTDHLPTETITATVVFEEPINWWHALKRALNQGYKVREIKQEVSFDIERFRVFPHLNFPRGTRYTKHMVVHGQTKYYSPRDPRGFVGGRE